MFSAICEVTVTAFHATSWGLASQSQLLQSLRAQPIWWWLATSSGLVRWNLSWVLAKDSLEDQTRCVSHEFFFLAVVAQFLCILCRRFNYIFMFCHSLLVPRNQPFFCGVPHHHMAPPSFIVNPLCLPHARFDKVCYMSGPAVWSPKTILRRWSARCEKPPSVAVFLQG